MIKLNKWLVGVVVIIIIAVGWFMLRGHSPMFGATTYPATSSTQGSYLVQGYLATAMDFILGSDQGGAGVDMQESNGTCASKSTTLFAVQNPFTATSTLTLASIPFVNGTTTIDILVGTSTTATAPANGNLTTPSLIDAVQVATSTKTYLVNGVTQGALAGELEAGGAARITVGPSQYVLAQATSSYAGSSATGLQGITSGNTTLACSYKLIWEK